MEVIALKTIETERLILRPFNILDCDDVYEYAKESIVGYNAGWKPHESISETIDIIQNVFIKNDDVWAIVLKEENKVIGSMGLHKRNAVGYELGYVINPLYWNHGYATEAGKAALLYGFKILNAPIITCVHFSDNLRSKRVIEKLGFGFKGINPMAYRRLDDKIVDLYIYAIYKEEK